MADRLIRICKNCKLQYVPDPVQHKDPSERCPRCGYKLRQDKDEEE